MYDGSVALENVNKKIEIRKKINGNSGLEKYN